MNMSNSILTSSTQSFFMDNLEEKETKSLHSKLDVKSAQSNVLQIIRKIFIILLFILVLILGIVSFLFGLVALLRNCYAPRQPAISYWLLILAGMKILLIVTLIIIYLLSVTCQYKSNETKCRVGFYITITIGIILLVWANALGTQAVFNLPATTTDCLGIIYKYGLAIYFIFVVCSIIAIGVTIYIHRKKCAKNQRRKITPREPPTNIIQTTHSDQCISVPNTETTSVDASIGIPTTEKEETLVDTNVEVNSPEKVSIE